MIHFHFVNVSISQISQFWKLGIVHLQKKQQNLCDSQFTKLGDCHHCFFAHQSPNWIHSFPINSPSPFDTSDFLVHFQLNFSSFPCFFNHHFTSQIFMHHTTHAFLLNQHFPLWHWCPSQFLVVWILQIIHFCMHQKLLSPKNFIITMASFIKTCFTTFIIPNMDINDTMQMSNQICAFGGNQFKPLFLLHFKHRSHHIHIKIEKSSDCGFAKGMLLFFIKEITMRNVTHANGNFIKLPTTWTSTQLPDTHFSLACAPLTFT